jgi:hypothetical protein
MSRLLSPLLTRDAIVALQEAEERDRSTAGRAAIGLLKYGCDTTRTDLTRLEWLRHAQHEALDLAVYLERLIADESSFDTPMGRIYGSCADV